MLEELQKPGSRRHYCGRDICMDNNRMNINRMDITVGLGARVKSQYIAAPAEEPLPAAHD